MQLTLLNATPQRRRIFIHQEELGTLDVNSIVFGAWQRFLLAPGESAYTAYGSFQLTARSLLPSAQHQTVQVEAPLGSAWAFQSDSNNAPALVPLQNGIPLGVSCANQSSGRVAIGIRNNYAPIVPDWDLAIDQTYTHTRPQTRSFSTSP